MRKLISRWLCKQVDVYYKHLLQNRTKSILERTKHMTSTNVIKGRRPRLLMLPDKRGWAFDELCRQRADYLSATWDVTIRYLLEKPEIDPTQFDIMFNPNQRYSDYDAMFHGRYIRGFFSLKWARQDMKYKFLYEKLKGAIACAAPSLEIVKKLKPLFPHVFQVKEGVDPAVFYWKKDRSDKKLVVGWTGNPAREANGLDVKRYYSVVKPACELADVELRTATNLNQIELNDFYNKVDVVVIASQPLFEGNPLAVYEAGACGRTVVATNVGTIPEIIIDGENGFVVEATFDNIITIEKLVGKLNWCKTNLEEVRSMGKNLQKAILQDRTQSKTCESFRNAIETALASLLSNNSNFKGW